MSPSAITSGCPCSVRSLSTVTRPARSCSAPAALASSPASAEARTPAAQMTVLAGRCSGCLALERDAVRIDAHHGGAQHRRHAELRKRSLCLGRQRRREGGQHALARLHEHDSRLPRVDRAEVVPQRVPRHLADLPRHLHAGRPGADDHEGQLRAPRLRVRLGFGLLERVQDPRAVRVRFRATSPPGRCRSIRHARSRSRSSPLRR